MRLQGTVSGLTYTWQLTVSKGDREDSTTTTVTVKKGEPPVPTITPFAGKANPTEKLSLASTVRVAANAVAQLQWSCEELDLAAEGVLASETAAGADLVLLPNSLTPGAVYHFILNASLTMDPSAWGSSALTVTVNKKPQGGSLTVTPLEGLSLDTAFTMSTGDWEDEDVPLDYYFAYSVYGSNSSNIVLSSLGPASTLSAMMPEEGLEEEDWRVDLSVFAKDRFGAMGDPQGEGQATNAHGNIEWVWVGGEIGGSLRGVVQVASITVTAPVLESEEAVAEYTAAMLDVTASATSQVTLTKESQQRLAGLVSRIVDCPPSELDGGSQDTALGVLGVLVRSTHAGDNIVSSPISMDTATEVFAGLDLLSSDDSTAFEVRSIMEDAAQAFLETLSSGESPSEVATGNLQMRAQKDQLEGAGSTAGRLFGKPAATPGEGPTEVVLPEALKEQLKAGGHTTVETRLLATSSDPHASANSTNGTDSDLEHAATRRRRLRQFSNASATWTSKVTTIELGGKDGTPIPVSNLTEPIAINMSIDVSNELQGVADPSRPPLVCSFWDVDMQAYDTAGCATLPNPAPPGAELFWRPAVWEALGRGEENAPAGISLAGSWGWRHAWLLEGCAETYAAADEWYNGTDVGERKYAGEGCAAADAGNAAGCSWNWTVRGFMGPGCELAEVLQCRCNHLTDFRAIDNLGSFEQTPKLNLLSVEDLTSFDPAEDFAKNTVFMAIIGSMAGGTLLLVCIFDYDDEQKRWKTYKPFISPFGTSRYWYQLELKRVKKTTVAKAVSKLKKLDRTTMTKVLIKSRREQRVPEAEKKAELSQQQDTACQNSPELDRTPTLNPLSEAPIDAPLPKDDHAGTPISSPISDRPGHILPSSMTASASFKSIDCQIPVPSVLETPECCDAAENQQAASDEQQSPGVSLIRMRSQAAFSMLSRSTDSGAAPGATNCNVVRMLHRSTTSGVSLGTADDGGGGDSSMNLGENGDAPESMPRGISPLALRLLKESMQSKRQSKVLGKMQGVLSKAHRGRQAPEGLRQEDGHVRRLTQRIAQRKHQGMLQVLDGCWRGHAPPPRSGRELWQLGLEHIRKLRLQDAGSSQKLTQCCHMPFLHMRTAIPVRFIRQAAAWHLEGKDEEEEAKEAERLPVERMLGTALVLAYLTKMRLMDPKELARQVALAKLQRWEAPRDRGFEWYFNVFRVMLGGNLSGPGWYKRTQLWTLVLLQLHDGSFLAGSGDLATALYAGEPEDSEEKLVLRFNWNTILDSLPPALLEAIPLPKDVDVQKDGRMRSTTVTAWATLLSIARYEALPFAWCTNPGAAPAEKRYLNDSADEWLAARAAEFPAFAARMEELKEAAKAQVQAWDDMHMARLQVIKNETIPPGSRVKRPLFRYRTVARARQVGFNEAFSRGERVVMLSTNWLVMVMFSVGFFYSKATQCCELLRAHVGCDSNLSAPCRYEGVDYATCALLAEGWKEDSDPEAGTFVCTAFPQNTLIARLYLVLIMCVLLIPIRLGLSTVFSMSGTIPPVPGHWSVKDAHIRVVFGPVTAGLVQATAFVAYALFVNLTKLNKAVAGLFVTFASRFVVPYIRWGIGGVRFLCAKLPAVWGDEVEEAPQRGLLLGAACGLLLLLRNKLFGSPMDTCVFAAVITLWLIISYVLLVYGN
eukprot:gene4280-5267_t